MKRPNLFFYSLIALFIISLTAITACETGRSARFVNQRNVDFNQGWKFMNDSVEGAEIPGFDDSSWRELDLPHDWSIEDYPVQDSTHTGPFFSAQERGDDVGYLRGGTGWYRKPFTLAKKDKGKQVLLHFDGVQTEMKLWVNGSLAGEHAYGYTPFYIDITSFLNPAGSPNQIAVEVINPGLNSRWFNGAGIYRPVSISVVDPICIDPWGPFIKTSQINDNEASVSIDLNIYNKSGSDADIHLVAVVISPEGSQIGRIEEDLKATGTGVSTSCSLELRIQDPQLWDLDYPSIYTANISIYHAGKQVDEYNTSFGIRSIEFTAENGFQLNGREVLMKGACMHHDNGLLGAAAFPGAEERRVRIMKENGYNAIRTSHNPPSAAFLDACDRLGMLVIDESFDMWVRPKRPNDYHLNFGQWWQRDLETMLLRDRNHPSVIMWSFGNEVQERADPEGVAIAGEMIAFIKSLDPTRPVTQAICAFWDNPGKEWDDSSPAFALLDVGGYNYQWTRYETDHQKYPNRIMYGSESVPKDAFDNWRLVKEKPYVIGDFVWTGMDYIGESGIGHADYQEDPAARGTFLKPWPWYVSWCGDIGITGIKKPQSYYRDVVWDRSRLQMIVHGPVPDGKQEVVSFWGWPRERKSWNWSGEEGEYLQVNVYASYPEVRLELNGETVGQEAINADSKLTATFQVPYEPGELIAYGIVDGTEQESISLRTTGEVSDIKLVPERTVIDADRNELVYIRVYGTDDEGHPVPDGSISMKVAVSGEGELLAAGNASPLAPGSLQDRSFNLFRGEALVIARSTGKPGSITVQVSSGAPDIQTRTTITVQ